MNATLFPQVLLRCNYPGTAQSLESYARAKHIEYLQSTEEWQRHEQQRHASPPRRGTGRPGSPSRGRPSSASRGGDQQQRPRSASRPLSAARPPSASRGPGTAGSARPTSATRGAATGTVRPPSAARASARPLSAGSSIPDVFSRSVALLGLGEDSAVDSIIQQYNASMRVTAHGPALERAAFALDGDDDNEDDDAETLELDGTALVNADDVKAVLARSPGEIRSLSLRRCRLTDAAAVAAVEALPLVSFLDLSDSTGLSAAGLAAVLHKLPQLRGVRLNGGGAVSFPEPEPAGGPRSAVNTPAAAATALFGSTLIPSPKKAPRSVGAAAAGSSFRLSSLLEDLSAAATVGRARPAPVAATAVSAAPRSGPGEPAFYAALARAAAAGGCPSGSAGSGSAPPPAAQPASIAENAAMLLAHVAAAPPHLLTEVTLSRCGAWVTDDVLMAFSGRTAAHLLPPPAPPAPAASAAAQRPTSAGRRAAAAASGARAAGRPLTGSAAAGAVEEDAAAALVKTNQMRARMGLAPEAASGSAAQGAAARRGSGDAGSAASKPAAPAPLTAAALFKVPTQDLPMPLQALDLTACHRLTDRAFAFIGANCPDLEFLRIRLCDQLAVSDAAVVAIAQGCPKLAVLDLRGMTQLTPTCIGAVARHCHELQRLCLAGCTLMEDAVCSVLSAAKCAATLVDLDVTRTRVSPVGARTALTRCPHLARDSGAGALNVTLCTAITPADLAELVEAFPGVRIICRRHTETDATRPALVPTFIAPPKEERFAARRVFCTYGDLAAKKKGKKKKGGKKKK